MQKNPTPNPLLKTVQVPKKLHDRLLKASREHGYRISAIVEAGVEIRLRQLEAARERG